MSVISVKQLHQLTLSTHTLLGVHSSSGTTACLLRRDSADLKMLTVT